MKKILIIVMCLAAAGVGYWLISPLFITREVDEGVEDILEATPPASVAEDEPSADALKSAEPALAVLRQGTFEGLAGHSGSGAASLIQSGGKYFVRFEDDFRVTNGPDLFVHFGKAGEYAAEARLGALKGNVGGQNYEVPSGVNPSDFDEVWVWCRAFSVPFARAVLE